LATATPWSAIPAVAKIVSFCDCEQWPRPSDYVKKNQFAKNLGQWPFSSEVIVWTYRNTYIQKYCFYWSGWQ